ncbi:MAG: hypothetical protein IJF44_02225 [Clostridia bacterium]|nr:hypothetical protein [Clostridia bacterium]
MSRKIGDTSAKNEKKGFFSKCNGKTKEILLFCLLAAILLFVAWRLFGGKDSETASLEMSETEAKVIRILEEIDGVGEASVMVYETEDGAQSAVVVCEGAERFSVVVDVREAVATALGIPQKSVKVYLKKE